MRITKATFKIGADVFEFEPDATDFKEQFAELYNLKPRSVCDTCGNADPEKFSFYVSKAKDKQNKEWTYVKVVCTPCGAASTLGTLLDNKGYWWKKFEKYVKPPEEA